jgi:hypothetical protein
MTRRLLLLLACGLCLSVSIAPAQDQKRSSNQGTIGVVPTESRNTTPDEVIGTAALVRHNLERAIDRLADGNLKEFTKSWAQAQKAYADLAEVLSEGTAQTAGAKARLDIAKVVFAGYANQTPKARDSAGRFEQISRELLQREQEYVNDLVKLREEYRTAKQEDRAEIEARMEAQLDQIKTMQAVRKELQGGHDANRASDDIRRMKEELDRAGEEIAQQARFFELTASACENMLAKARDEFALTLKLYEIRAILPANQLERLKQFRQNTKQILSMIGERDDARRRLSGSLGPIVPPRPRSANPDELLREVEAVIRQNGSPKTLKK